MSKVRRYSELIKLTSFKERFEYLQLNGIVGDQTFGPNRYFNQSFYQRDPEWLSIRSFVIVRDHGCDLGYLEREIPDGVPIIIHHMNPITIEDILHRTEFLLNPEYLITTIDNTHKAIHYGNYNLIVDNFVERKPNDTCPWKN